MMNDKRAQPKVAAVIPCYNVSRACADVIERTRGQVDLVIAVDDGSTDDTLDFLDRAGCQVVRLPVNQGKGVALRRGFEAALAAGCDYVVTLDGDGQHLPEEIAPLVSHALRSDSDLVVGVRKVSRMPLRSQFGNLWTRWLYRAQTKSALADTQSGFRVFKAEALRAMMDRIRWGRYDTEMDMLLKYQQAGMRVASAPISTVYIDDNRLTSFRTLTDSMRVFLVLVRYGVAGIVAAGVEFALFAALMWPMGEHYGWALVISRVAGLIAHYFATRFFAFRVRRRIGPAEVLSYSVVAGVNLGASYGLLVLLIAWGGLGPILSKAISQIVLFVATFVMLQKWTFRVGAAREG